MRRYDVKIKSTGFGFFPFFLPIFLAAFVEQDEKSLEKASNFKQMSILSSGTFANVLTGIFFFAVMWLFFSLAFTPAGVEFDTYTYSLVNVSAITSINGIALQSPSYEKIVELSGEELNKIKTDNRNYIAREEILSDEENKILAEEKGIILLYDDAPAINAEIKGVIKKIDGVEIKSIEQLSEELKKHSPGDKIEIIMFFDNSYSKHEITLEKSPYSDGAWLGIGFKDYSRSGIIGKIVDSLSSFKEPHTYYEEKIKNLSLFIYNLLWWTILISISVALVNMLPVGIFDGGRFFYLTILSLTGSQENAKKCFKFITYLFLFIILLLMVFWILSFI